MVCGYNLQLSFAGYARLFTYQSLLLVYPSNCSRARFSLLEDGTYSTKAKALCGSHVDAAQVMELLCTSLLTFRQSHVMVVRIPCLIVFLLFLLFLLLLVIFSFPLLRLLRCIGDQLARAIDA